MNDSAGKSVGPSRCPASCVAPTHCCVECVRAAWQWEKAKSVRGKEVIEMLFFEITFVFKVHRVPRGGKMLWGSDQSGFGNSLLMKKHPRLFLQLPARVQAFCSKCHLLIFQKQRESVAGLGNLHGVSASDSCRTGCYGPHLRSLRRGGLLLTEGGGDFTTCTYPTFQHLRTLSHNYSRARVKDAF